MDWLPDAFSKARFARYTNWAGGDQAGAMALYAANMQLSEALHTSLHMLEVVFRNRINDCLTGEYGKNWFDDTNLITRKFQRDLCLQAYKAVANRRREAVPQRIIPELSFGFWTEMLSRDNENLWQKTLKSIAKRENGGGLRRQELSEKLDPSRHLRNRVSHYEPILYEDLSKAHRHIDQILRWLSPSAADWCARYDRFPEVFAANQHALRQRPVRRFRRYG
jgi:hypothetical protein